jgi:hypothetical protein
MKHLAKPVSFAIPGFFVRAGTLESATRQVAFSANIRTACPGKQTLKEKRGYAKEKAARICHLLGRIPDSELKSPNTYQDLIGYLDHENLIVRDLAFWHLAQLVPEGAAQIAYDPLAEADQRKQRIQQWQILVPPRKVPRMPP